MPRSKTPFAGSILMNSRRSWRSQWCADSANTWNGWRMRPLFPSDESRESRILMRFAFVLLLLFASLARGAEPDLLEPDKAFRFSARLKDAHSIEVNYQIAPGYYLYRDKFQFALTPAEAKPGAAQFPRGEKHKDEFFGEVETYRGNLSFVLPFELAKADVSSIRLAVTSQGCADAGVCYVPYEQK